MNKGQQTSIIENALVYKTIVGTHTLYQPMKPPEIMNIPHATELTLHISYDLQVLASNFSIPDSTAGHLEKGKYIPSFYNSKFLT